ncbi:unnamed protein product [Enterobius vermicularis]|uniref:60S ribosomal protein L29 n=1 Tax=Enterobius vermicularis TaxID=51028 RepID=A0A0N4VQW6_ENTVE|nr:unnamed protein product [Enterobius vermicularis]
MGSGRHTRKARKIRPSMVLNRKRSYKKYLERKRQWQSNAVYTGHRTPNVAVPPPTTRKIKEKKLDPEKQARRQQQREQERLKKTLASQQASTSEIKKPNQLKVSRLKAMRW